MSSETGIEGTTALSDRLINLSRPGRQLPVYIAGPDDSKSYPGLILIHEIFGLNEHIKDVARRFARQSLRVYAPDLFAAANGLPEDRHNLDAMRKVWSELPDSELIDDLKAVLEFALASKEVKTNQIGTLGFCMGGAIAYMFGCSEPRVSWIIDFYGRIRYPLLSDKKPKHPVDYTAGLKCPVLGLFSGIDELIPPADRQLLAEQIESQGKHLTLKVYENAPHAFFNDSREHYRAEAAEDAWRLSLDFITRICQARV
jgi:carboxymethylenebutenolidase